MVGVDLLRLDRARLAPAKIFPFKMLYYYMCWIIIIIDALMCKQHFNIAGVELILILHTVESFNLQHCMIFYKMIIWIYVKS